MEFTELFKDNATILLALIITMVTFFFVVINPTVTVPPLMESWGNIALGFFFGSGTTVMAYRMGSAK